MTKSDKIREYFRKHPDAEVAKVAAKFEASKPMTYKLRGQVVQEWTPPEMVPMPDPVNVARNFKFTGTSVDGTLDNRAQDYGKFIEGAEIMQMLKRIVHNYIEARGTKLAFDQREAIDMIIHKLGRIINGNPDKVDTWVDIAGYAKLVADRLEGVER